MTDRRLSRGDFLQRITDIAACNPTAIILREKDMDNAEYKALAAKVIDICRQYNTTCILHSHIEAAMELNWNNIHIPLPVLRGMTEKQRKSYSILGSSCHSIEEAAECEELGCSYVIAGHIFDTECKKGLPGRGIEFYKKICSSISIPAFAIGGISPENYMSLADCHGAGICTMSNIMKCENAGKYLGEFV